ncbi:MAG: hypothetical protein ACRDWF_15165 [Acidimicrobiia bacterium]
MSLVLPFDSVQGACEVGVGLAKHPGFLYERLETFLRVGMEEIAANGTA